MICTRVRAGQERVASNNRQQGVEQDLWCTGRIFASDVSGVASCKRGEDREDRDCTAQFSEQFNFSATHPSIITHPSQQTFSGDSAGESSWSLHTGRADRLLAARRKHSLIQRPTVTFISTQRGGQFFTLRYLTTFKSVQYLRLETVGGQFLAKMFLNIAKCLSTSSSI